MKDELRNSIAIMARLRGPGGCPWDREQTFDSIMRHTLEETYEVFDAIERRDFGGLKDELGDLLLQVLFYSQMAAEEGHFTIDDVAANLNAKLIRRHPHIFGDVTAATTEEVNRNWEAIKRVEKGEPPPASLMDEVPRHVPAMTEAKKLGAKAATVGFDWPDAAGLIDKLREETAELEVEIRSGSEQQKFDELGDLLFTAVNLARHLKIEPEFALRTANAKFRARFTRMELASGTLADRPADELDELWRAAKKGDF